MYEQFSKVVSIMSGHELSTYTPSHHDVEEQPQIQLRQYQLLTSAFKGSVHHDISSSGRKPSVLKLTKREDSGHNTLLTSGLPQSVEGGTPTKPASGNQIANQSEGRHTLRHTHRMILDPNLPVDGDSTEQQKQRQLQLQEQIQQQIQFHHHTDQSLSKIDVTINAERQWLAEHPQSENWLQLHGRISDAQSEAGLALKQHQEDLADRFISTALLQGAAHVNNLLNGADNEKERLVVKIAFGLLDNIVAEMILLTCADIAKSSSQSWSVLSKSLVKSLASVSLGLEGSSSR